MELDTLAEFDRVFHNTMSPDSYSPSIESPHNITILSNPNGPLHKVDDIV